ncbi:hypothetical protein WA026_004597, partial [Henosepilachna vigintioctopunctata]
RLRLLICRHTFSANISDHLAERLEIEYTKRKIIPTKKRNITLEKLKDLQRDLCEEDWYGTYNVNNDNEKFAIFLRIFCLYCDKHIPMKCMNTIREYKPSQEERHMKKTLDLMREAYEQNRNVNTLKAFKEYKKHYLEFVQKNKRMIESYMLIINRATWQIINTGTGKTNNKYTRSSIHSEVFNKFFASMGQNITKEIETTSKV